MESELLVSSQDRNIFAFRTRAELPAELHSLTLTCLFPV